MNHQKTLELVMHCQELTHHQKDFASRYVTSERKTHVCTSHTLSGEVTYHQETLQVVTHTVKKKSPVISRQRDVTSGYTPSERRYK